MCIVILGLSHLTGFLVWVLCWVTMKNKSFQNFEKAIGFWMALVAGILCFLHVFLLGFIKVNKNKGAHKINMKTIGI